MNTHTWNSRDRARELLARCDEEIGDASGAALLQAEFSRVLDSDSAIALLDVGQFCRAFALAATELALGNRGAWTRESVLQLAEMCYHHGDSAEGDALVDMAEGM